MQGGDSLSLHVAVASNFAQTLEEVGAVFEREIGISLVLSPGSTGKHYAQIVHGAPFDVFLAADAEHPQRLVEQGFGVAGSNRCYAMGRLVLWSAQPGFVDKGIEVLEQNHWHHLAVANPEFAPYGKAARSALEGLGLWQSLQARLVRGENVGQAFQFVLSGNAELGLVARSQVLRLAAEARGSIWEVPQTMYPPLRQYAVILRDGDEAKAFLQFLLGEEARKIIRAAGYDLP